MCVYLRAPVQEVQEHKVHSPRANSQQFPLSSTVADVPAEACRHEITRIIREGYLRASWSIESRARLVFFSLIVDIFALTLLIPLSSLHIWFYLYRFPRFTCIYGRYANSPEKTKEFRNSPREICLIGVCSVYQECLGYCEIENLMGD